MKVGSESRGKLIAAILLMVVAALLVGNWLFNSSGAPVAATAARPADNALALDDPATSAQTARKVTHTKKDTHSLSLDPTLRLDWLKLSEDTEYKGSGRNIFQAQIEPPKPIAPAVTDHPKPVNVAPVPTGPPPPPPIELVFFGFASRPGETKRVFLRQGGDVFIAGEGEIVDRRYKVLRIMPSAVEIEDVLNNNRQEIPLTQG
jgi:hypothetical protein